MNFAPDKNRNDALEASFGIDHGHAGPPGVSDVDSLYFRRECWLDALNSVNDTIADCLNHRSEAYGWSYIEPGETWWTFKVTVKKTADKTLKARSEIWEGDKMIDGNFYVFPDVPRTAGQIAIGISAAQTDLYIDDFQLKAADPIVDEGVMTLNGNPVQLWLPPGNKPVNGVLHAYPPFVMAPGGSGDHALFNHLRQFAIAHNWALASGATNLDQFKAGLDMFSAMGTRSSRRRRFSRTACS